MWTDETKIYHLTEADIRKLPTAAQQQVTPVNTEDQALRIAKDEFHARDDISTSEYVADQVAVWDNDGWKITQTIRGD